MDVYLSKLIVNTRNPMGLRSLADPYEAHRTIWRGFPDEDDGGPGRVLFRVESLEAGRPAAVMVQSCIEPDWQSLLSEGVLQSAQHKEVRTGGIRIGQLLRFRLKANPTKKIADDKRPRADGSPRPARVGLFGDEQQMDWLRGKAEMGGFTLVECRIMARENSESSKAGVKDKITHLGVVFDGVLEVTEADTFRACLASGIGSAKGFGFGLLSIAPVR